jgi:hypothetical protein
MHDLQGVSPLTPLALGQSRIEMSNVGPLIDRLPGGRSRLTRIVHRVNLALSTIRESWHNASAVEPVAVMDRCNESIEAMLEQLESPGFREHARLEAINLLRSAPHDSRQRTRGRRLRRRRRLFPSANRIGGSSPHGSWRITEESVVNFPSALSILYRSIAFACRRRSPCNYDANDICVRQQSKHPPGLPKVTSPKLLSCQPWSKTGKCKRSRFTCPPLQ